MYCVAGDENGLLKHAKFGSKEYVASGEQSRSQSVKSLTWITEDGLFGVLRANGLLEEWKSSVDGIEFCSAVDTEIADPITTFCAGDDRVCCVGADGKISIRKRLEESHNDFLHVNGPLTVCKPYDGGVACGGFENDIKLYDITTGSVIWEAENVPNDKLDLRVPIWVTALSFPSSDAESPSGSVFAAGTGYKHLRLYDTRSATQPITSLEIGEYRVTSIQHSPQQQHSVYVGDTAGGMGLWDLRMRRKLFTLKGCAGSVRDIQMTADGDYLSCVGLDRVLHWYNARTHKLVSTTYLKNRLNCCLLWGSGSPAQSDGEDSNSGDSDGEEDDDDDGGTEDVVKDFLVSSDEEEEDDVGALGDEDGEPLDDIVGSCEDGDNDVFASSREESGAGRGGRTSEERKRGRGPQVPKGNKGAHNPKHKPSKGKKSSSPSPGPKRRK